MNINDFSIEEIEEINSNYKQQQHFCQKSIYENQHTLKMHKFDGCEAQKQGNTCDREEQLNELIGEAKKDIIIYDSIVKKTDVILTLAKPLE